MSVATEITDAILLDLTDNVDSLSALSEAQVHRYTSKAIDALIQDGRKHLAVWPVQDRPQQTQGAFTQDVSAALGAISITYDFMCIYWEPSPEAENVKADQDAAANLLDLAEEMRARFLVNANRVGVRDDQTMWKLDWTGTQVDTGGNQTPALVRMIALSFSASIAVDYT